MCQFAALNLFGFDGKKILRNNTGPITPPQDPISCPRDIVLEPIVVVEDSNVLSRKKAKINYFESTKVFLKKHESNIDVFVGLPLTYTRLLTKKDVTNFVKSKILESKNQEIKGIQIKYDIAKGLVNLRELYTLNNVTDIKALLAAVQLEFEMKER